MSDSLSQPESEPEQTSSPDNSAAQPNPNPPTENFSGRFVEEIEGKEVVVPDDPAAFANDRAGFKFLAIGFAIFFAIIAVFAGIVAMVMKSMGI